jgi:hypothetical protein
MRGKIAALLAALVLSAGLGVPASAQAAARFASSPQRGAAAAAAGYGTCTSDFNQVYDVGNHEWIDLVNTVNVYFSSTDASSFYCIPIGSTGRFQMLAPLGNDPTCLSVNSKTKTVNQEPTAGCAAYNGAGYEWDQWIAYSVGTYNGHTAWELENYYNFECLYDDLQVNAIYAPCASSDHFEWFTWASLS